MLLIARYLSFADTCLFEPAFFLGFMLFAAELKLFPEEVPLCLGIDLYLLLSESESDVTTVTE